MKFLIRIALYSGLCLLLWFSSAAPQQQRWLFYSPAVSRLEGKLTKVLKYGSPTYGEHPEQDEKLDVPILILQLPIRVKNPTPSVKTESTNVSFVQLIFPAEAGSYAKYLNATIVVEGTLAKGAKGKHFTDLVMTVNTVNPAEPPVY